MSLPSLLPGRVLLLLGGLTAAPALAQADEPRPLMHPGHLDLRLEGAASLLPLSLEAGAAVDLGVLRVGPGTLSVGAEFDVNQCALACWVPNLFTQRDVSRRDFYGVGRLGYHFTLANRNYREVDLYGVLLGGVMETRTTLTAPDYAYAGKGRAPAFGLGLGGHYFPSRSSRFFVGGEARLRFSTGSSELTLTRGTYAFTQEDRRWTRLGLSTAFFLGVRLF
jgi:hypothetical protein